MSEAKGNMQEAIASIVSAVLLLSVAAVFFCWLWRIEGRTKEDTAFLVKQEKIRLARSARATMPLIERIASCESELGNPQIESEERRRLERLARNLKNIVAYTFPELVESKDDEGNASLVPLRRSIKFLERLISEGRNV